MTGASLSTETRDENHPSRLRHFAACVTCRKRKLRCDGQRPHCVTCSKAGRNCEFEEVRKGQRKKRTSIKVLEARLAELESRTRQSSQDEASPESLDKFMRPVEKVSNTHTLPIRTPSPWQTHAAGSILPGQPDTLHDRYDHPDFILTDPRFDEPQPYDGNSENPFALPAMEFYNPLEMVGLGVEEPLPPQEVQDDLFRIFFSPFNHRIPMIHKGRFLAAASLPQSSRMRPPVCLLYAIWMMAAAESSVYRSLTDHFYRRARKYLEIDEMKDFGVTMCTIAHAQAFLLVAVHEGQMMYAPRSYLTIRKATGISMMLGLHRLDGIGLPSGSVTLPPCDAIEMEQRRRTFWAIFNQDRYCSLASGWTAFLDEREVQTNMPSSEEAFEQGISSRGISLQEAMTTDGLRQLSRFGKNLILTLLCGRTVLYLHRPDRADNRADDLDSCFWKTYRNTDSLLQDMMPMLKDCVSQLGSHDDWIERVELYIKALACKICLHQAGLFKAGRNVRFTKISQECVEQGLESALRVAQLAKLLEADQEAMPGSFLPYWMYLAARVFARVLREDKTQFQAQKLEPYLDYLLQAMRRLVKYLPYTEFLMVQLEIDMHALGGENPVGHITTVSKDIIDKSRSESKTPGSINHSEHTPGHSAPDTRHATPAHGVTSVVDSPDNHLYHAPVIMAEERVAFRVQDTIEELLPSKPQPRTGYVVPSQTVSSTTTTTRPTPKPPTSNPAFNSIHNSLNTTTNTGPVHSKTTSTANLRTTAPSTMPPSQSHDWTFQFDNNQPQFMVMPAATSDFDNEDDIYQSTFSMDQAWNTAFSAVGQDQFY